jgi:glutaredoxin 3
MTEVTMYSTRTCTYCRSAEQLLGRKSNVQLKKILVDADPAQLKQMIELTGQRTVPQIFVGTTHVGGFTDLLELDNAGRLDTLLAG